MAIEKGDAVVDTDEAANFDEASSDDAAILRMGANQKSKPMPDATSRAEGFFIHLEQGAKGSEDSIGGQEAIGSKEAKESSKAKGSKEAKKSEVRLCITKKPSANTDGKKAKKSKGAKESNEAKGDKEAKAIFKKPAAATSTSTRAISFPLPNLPRIGSMAYAKIIANIRESGLNLQDGLEMASWNWKFGVNWP